MPTMNNEIMNQQDDTTMMQYTFIDGSGDQITTMVTPEIFEVLQEEQREHRRYAMEHRRRRSNYKFDEEFVENNFAYTRESLEDDVLCEMEIERFYEFLENRCTELQRKRYIQYIQGYTLEQMSEIHDCSIHAIECSLNGVKKKIKKYFSKTT